MPYDILLTLAVLISSACKYSGCTVTIVQSVVSVVTFLVQDEMTMLPWKTRAGQASLLIRI